jgi:twitching motility protein PilT
VNVKIPTFQDLNLPAPVLEQIASYNQGLVILAGVTGSGKSTTIAAMIEYINSNQKCHIVTIEDPIEYLYSDKKSFINQREVGVDVDSFKSALKYVVRQDPDVILVGEMRDAETLEAGLQAAETGHLVFGTLHASDVSSTVGRILDLFPADREKQIRQSLSFNLKAVVCQKLLPSCKEGISAVVAQEIMTNNITIQKLILMGEDKKIKDVVRGATQEGMQDFNQALVKLVNENFISKDMALSVSTNPDQLKMNLKGIYLGQDKGIIG